jgi:hypothetical protein
MEEKEAHLLNEIQALSQDLPLFLQVQRAIRALFFDCREQKWPNEREIH